MKTNSLKFQTINYNFEFSDILDCMVCVTDEKILDKKPTLENPGQLIKLTRI